MQRKADLRAYLALVAVCIFWGTTYLTIRMSLEGFPPLILVAARFTLSGSIMLIGARLVGARFPRGQELRVSIVTALFVLGIGNGCLVFAEQWIPSGLAALIITVSPFWLVGIESIMPGGERLHGPTLAGLLVGCAGAVLLVLPDVVGQHFGGNVLKGFLILQFSTLSWTAGSLYQKRYATTSSPIVSGAVQQLTAGLAFVVLALLIPEPAIVWKPRAVAALLYLVFFGSIVGYSSYVYSLNHLPIAIVSIYPYVNTVVAVFLGWLFYREHFGLLELAAMCIIFSGVALVKRYSPKKS